MTVIFGCGHQQETDGQQVPVCQACGERRVRHVVAPAPKFVGICKGPSASYQALPAIGVQLGAKESA